MSQAHPGAPARRSRSDLHHDVLVVSLPRASPTIACVNAGLTLDSHRVSDAEHSQPGATTRSTRAATATGSPKTSAQAEKVLFELTMIEVRSCLDETSAKKSVAASERGRSARRGTDERRAGAQAWGSGKHITRMTQGGVRKRGAWLSLLRSGEGDGSAADGTGARLLLRRIDRLDAHVHRGPARRGASAAPARTAYRPNRRVSADAPRRRREHGRSTDCTLQAPESPLARPGTFPTVTDGPADM